VPTVSGGHDASSASLTRAPEDIITKPLNEQVHDKLSAVTFSPGKLEQPPTLKEQWSDLKTGEIKDFFYPKKYIKDNDRNIKTNYFS